MRYGGRARVRAAAARHLGVAHGAAKHEPPPPTHTHTYVHIGEPALALQQRAHVRPQRHGVRVLHVLPVAGGGHAHAHALRAPHADARVQRLAEEARAVGNGAAVRVRARVAGGAQELIREIAIRRVQLHAVKPRGLGERGRRPVLRHDARNVLQRGLARRAAPAAKPVGPGLCRLLGGAHRRQAAVELLGGGAALVPQLQEDAPALCVHRVRHQPPPRRLRLIVAAR